MKKILLLTALAVALFSCEKDEDSPVTSISLDVSELTLKVGDDYQFKVNRIPANSKEPLYEWNISRNSYFADVGDIDQNGKFTAFDFEGNTIVTVMAIGILKSDGTPLTATCMVKVEPVGASSIKLSKNNITLDPGESETLTYSILPENTTHKDVIWAISNTTTVTNVRGLITAVTPGEVDITVTIQNTTIKDVCRIKVNPKALEGIAFDIAEKTTTKGESFLITPIFIPALATNKTLKWSSSNENVAHVDNEGAVSAIGLGECVITAISEDGGFNASYKVIVNPAYVQNISFPDSEYSIEIGTTRKLSVDFTPANAENKNLFWTSQNPAIASVDNNGNVMANDAGETTISVRSEDGGYTASCKVSVKDILQFMKLSITTNGAIINGFIIGYTTYTITNNSSHTIKLISLSVIDGNTSQYVAYSTDESLLGYLDPGESRSLGGLLNSVYKPISLWAFEYNGIEYSIYTQYDNSWIPTDKIIPNGKANNLIQLKKQQ